MKANGVAVVLAVAAAWFGSVSWAGAIFTFALFTALHVVLAPVADLAAWRPLDGVCVAALAGAGSGAIWWAAVRPDASIWLSIATGVTVGLLGVWGYADTLRRVGPPVQPATGAMN